MYKKRVVIKKVVQSLRDGNSIMVAVKNSGLRSVVTFWNWRKKSPRLDALIKAAEGLCEDRRNKYVEDKFFQRFQDSVATPTDFIFYLTNRMPSRWADKRALAHISPTFVNKNEQNNILEGYTTDELRSLLRAAEESL
ncbi:MAG: terminase small subunit [Siphoviridae sp. ctCJE6]|nr:MAG: terminase small subunit [Siphoviridae sp. ctCJE6]